MVVATVIIINSVFGGFGGVDLMWLAALTVRLLAQTKGERSKRQLLNSLRIPIYVINSVAKTKLPCDTLHAAPKFL